MNDEGKTIQEEPEPLTPVPFAELYEIIERQRELRPTPKDHPQRRFYHPSIEAARQAEVRVFREVVGFFLALAVYVGIIYAIEWFVR